MLTCPACENQVEGTPKFCPSCGANLAVVASAGGDPYIGKLVAGKYLVEKVLGEGGMGKVYLAVQQPLDKKVVLKVLRQALHGDASLVARFQREARAASRLTHPNSIQVTDFGQMEDGALYIAMEYLEGRDLGEVLKEDGPLPQGRLIHIMDQVLSALADAHAANIIHRDMKPENVMVVSRRDDVDTVKVLDFGIAKIQDPVDSPDAVALTQQGLVCGTPEYMSPEQAKGEKLDARSDLYAIGVILFQLSTGKLPFNADTSVGMVTKHLIEEPPPARTINPQVTTGLEALILRCMAKEPDDRPSTAVDLRALLKALDAPGASAGAPMAGTTPATAAGGTDPEPMVHPPVAPPGDPSISAPGMPPSSGLAPYDMAEGTEIPGQRSGKLFAAIGVGAILLAAAGGYYVVSSRSKKKAASGGTPIAVVNKDPGAAGDAGKAAGTQDPGAPGQGTEGDVPPVAADPSGAGDSGTEARPDPGATAVAAAKDPGKPRHPHAQKHPHDPKKPAAERGNPRLARKYSRDAQKAWAGGRFQQAIALWEKAARADPRDPMVARRLGNAYYSQGDTRRGKQQLRRYLKLSPRARDRAMVEEMIRSG